MHKQDGDGMQTQPPRETQTISGGTKQTVARTKKEVGREAEGDSLLPKPLSRRTGKKYRPEDTHEAASRGGCRDGLANTFNMTSNPETAAAADSEAELSTLRRADLCPSAEEFWTLLPQANSRECCCSALSPPLALCTVLRMRRWATAADDRLWRWQGDR